jgi:hypothetical protein
MVAEIAAKGNLIWDISLHERTYTNSYTSSRWRMFSHASSMCPLLWIVVSCIPSQDSLRQVFSRTYPMTCPVCPRTRPKWCPETKILGQSKIGRVQPRVFAPRIDSRNGMCWPDYTPWSAPPSTVNKGWDHPIRSLDEFLPSRYCTQQRLWSKVSQLPRGYSHGRL